MDTSQLLTTEELIAGFWAAAAQERLVRPVCERCGASSFTPSVACPHCQSESWSWVDSAGTGRIASCTAVHQGPDTTWDVPYTLVVVDLDDEGWSMLSRLAHPAPDLGPDRDHELIGSAVRVTFQPEGREPHRTLPVFEVIA